MAILSSTSRRSTEQSPNVINLFKIFTASVVYLSNVDVITSDVDSDLLPLALNKLVLSTKEWRSAAPQILEWMVRLSRDKKTRGDVKAVLNRAFPAFKSSRDASVAQIILSNFDVIYSE